MRLIDATELKGRMMDMIREGYGLEDMVDAVIEFPTVVRCADCDKWITEMRAGNVCPCEEWSYVEDGRLVYTEEHEFCSRSELKGGDE